MRVTNETDGLNGDTEVINGYNVITNIARESKKAMLNQDWK